MCCSPGGECYVEEVRRIAERADECYQEETFVYVLHTARRTMKWKTGRTLKWNDGSRLHVVQNISLGALGVFKYMRQSGGGCPCGLSHTLAREPLRDAVRRSGRLSIRQACARDLRGKMKASNVFSEASTEVDVLRRGAGRTCLMLVCVHLLHEVNIWCTHKS